MSFFFFLAIVFDQQTKQKTRVLHYSFFFFFEFCFSLIMTSVKSAPATMVPPPPPPPPPQSSAAPLSFCWQPAALYQRGVQTYRAAVAYVARVWTPPPALDGVESASFVFVLSTALVVMEGYHAARYTVRQLRRFKTEAGLQHITLLSSGLPDKREGTAAAEGTSEAVKAVDKKPRETEETQDTEAEAEAAEDVSAPPSWVSRAMQRLSAVLPSRAVKPDDHHDASDVEDAGGTNADNPLQLLDIEDSDMDFMSRGVSVPYDMSNMPSQHRVNQVSHATTAATDNAQNTGVHDEDEEEEEEQTWEATPEMLMHYWKQLERTILTAPRHNPKRFFRDLPAEMTNCEPDIAAVNTWFDDVTRHLQRGSPAWWSWLKPVAAAPEVERPIKQEVNLEAPTARIPGWQQRLTFTVPPSGCFAYHTKPPPDDFFPDTEEDEESSEEEQQPPPPQQQEGEGTRERLAGALAREGSSAGDGAVTTGRTAEKEGAAANSVSDNSADARDSHEGQQSQRHKRRHILHWEALLLVWFNVADVPMSSREIRALLLKASPPAFMNPAMVQDNGPTDFDLASTNLSILWFWSTLQRVFETLVINEDVEKCEEDLKELQSYAMPLFFKCIARWPVPSQMRETSEVAFRRGLVCFVCVVQSTWVTLNAVMDKLLALRRRLFYRNTWSLVRYMYSSSKAKMMSAALITVMMTISSRVSAAGRVVRERIASYVDSAGADDGGGAKMSLRLMLGLCAFELTRMAVQYVVSNTTSEFIVLTASQRREVVKMQLYEALSHTQLTFYEQHTYEEVEEIVYYVNDMEGIDVQLHQYLFNAINVFIELRDALRPFTYRSMAVAAGVAMAPYALRSIATLVEQRYLLAKREGYLPSGAYAVEDEYHGDDDDDSNVLREGAMLRGDEIIAAIPQLRPYGADVRLVRWWNRHQQRRQHIRLPRHQQAAAASAEVQLTASRAASPLNAHTPTFAERRGTSAGGGTGDAARRPRMTWGEYLQSLVGGWLTDEDIGLMRSAIVALVQLPHGKLLPGSGKAMLDLSEWLLPMAASAYGITWCRQPNLDPFQLVQGMQAIEAAVDSISEAMDTAEMVGYNAYKASMLERLLQPTQWEVISREEEPYMANFTISATGVGQANDARQICIEQSRLLTKPLLTVAAARAAGFYRRHVLRHIEIKNIHLRRVPMDPTERRRRHRGPPSRRTGAGGSLSSATATPRSTQLESESSSVQPNEPTATTAAAAPASTTDDDDDEDAAEEMLNDGAPLFSADIVLWSPLQQRGRFVCVTGPNGGGKTALVNLLLALYVNACGPLPSSVASSPHAGRLGAGSVIFCFAHRTRTRRHRRGGLTSRGTSISSPNFSRTARSSVSGMAMDRTADGVVESRVDIRTVPADVLRRHIFSYVPEIPTIFSGATVAQNISLAGYVSVATDALMRRATQCAELAQCDFIQRLPLGLLTRISDSTANSWNTAGQYSTGAGNNSVIRLSADQAKRLMLARAYFQGGEVLLMDEPTKEIEDVATAQRMCDGWRRLLDRGYCNGVVCLTMDETLLKMADEVITLP